MYGKLERGKPMSWHEARRLQGLEYIRRLREQLKATGETGAQGVDKALGDDSES